MDTPYLLDRGWVYMPDNPTGLLLVVPIEYTDEQIEDLQARIEEAVGPVQVARDYYGANMRAIEAEYEKGRRRPPSDFLA